MRFSRSIVDHATEAVKTYRKISGIEHDNRLPEVFLGSQIALGLYKDFQVNTRVESYFTNLARDLGQSVTMDLVDIMGGWRADIAVYEQERPSAVIEIKIHDEGRSADLVLRDRDKLRQLSQRTGIETYLGVLVTDTAKETCTARAEALGRRLEKPFDVRGEPVRAGGGSAGWSWLFACGAFA